MQAGLTFNKSYKSDNVSTNGTTSKVVTSLYSYRWSIPIGYFLYGIGGMLIWPLSISFIDTNAAPGQSGILLGKHTLLINVVTPKLLEHNVFNVC